MPVVNVVASEDLLTREVRGRLAEKITAALSTLAPPAKVQIFFATSAQTAPTVAVSLVGDAERARVAETSLAALSEGWAVRVEPFEPDWTAVGGKLRVGSGK